MRVEGIILRVFLRAKLESLFTIEGMYKNIFVFGGVFSLLYTTYPEKVAPKKYLYLHSNFNIGAI